MSTDATPSWSGYIFQGEVALCKALEKICLLGEDIDDKYCLRLEQDEDFSIKTDDLEIFQVKAYLSKDSNKLAKYKEVIKELIDKYHYSKQSKKDPADGRKRITTYSDKKRTKPLKCALITDKFIIDYEQDLSSFDEKYKNIDLTKFDVIHGEYTLVNITEKIDNEIKKMFPSNSLRPDDIALKRNFCLNNIVRIIKIRHSNKIVEPIFLHEIKNWIFKSDIALNVEIFWLTIVQTFLKELSKRLPLYDLTNPYDLILFEKLSDCYEKVNDLGFEGVKKLIKDRLNAHKMFSEQNIAEHLSMYMDTVFIYSIVTKAIEGIIKTPEYENLVFDHNDEKYQLSLISLNISDPPTGVDKIELQQFFKNIQENNLSDVDYIITDQISFDKDSVADLSRNITDVPETFSDSSIDITNPTKKFGLVNLRDTIKNINS